MVALQAIGDAGYDKINVTVTAGVATLSGVTPEGGVTGLVVVVEEVPGINQVVDMTEASDRADMLDSELKRITSVTPLIFAVARSNWMLSRSEFSTASPRRSRRIPGPS